MKKKKDKAATINEAGNKILGNSLFVELIISIILLIIFTVIVLTADIDKTLRILALVAIAVNLIWDVISYILKVKKVDKGSCN